MIVPFVEKLRVRDATLPADGVYCPEGQKPLPLRAGVVSAAGRQAAAKPAIALAVRSVRFFIKK
jgi:hypothetical protein